MSAGSQNHVVRLTADIRARIDRCIKRRNAHSREEPWILSTFLRVMIERGLKKMERSRKPRRRKSPPSALSL